MTSIEKTAPMWELAARYFSSLDEAGGEITPEVQAAEMAIMQKVDACRFVTDMLHDQAERTKERAVALKAKQNALERARERIEKNLLEVIMRNEKTELTGVESVAKLVRNPKSLKINEQELHPMMLMQVTETVPDKKRIRELLESGHEVGGARFEHSYRIKWIERTEE